MSSAVNQIRNTPNKKSNPVLETGMYVYIDGKYYGKIMDTTENLVFVKKEEDTIPNALLLETVKKLFKQKRLTLSHDRIVESEQNQ